MFSVMALIAATPYTKLIHVFTSASNIVLAPEKPRGRLSTPFSLAAMLETGNVETPPNAHTAGGFSPSEAPRPRRVHQLREVPGGLPGKRSGEGPLA